LENALQQVSEWERERGQVLRQASHDLRGSLSVVLGASSPARNLGSGREDRTRVTRMLQGGVQALNEMLGRFARYVAFGSRTRKAGNRALRCRFDSARFGRRRAIAGERQRTEVGD
jgi:signal transduction histidine kinase